MLELLLLPTRCGILEEKKDFKTQLFFAERSMFLADSLKNDPYIVYSGLNLGSAYINTNSPKKAIPLLKKSLQVLEEYQDYAALNSGYHELFRAYDSLQKPDSALYFYKLTVAYQDSIDISQSNDKINELLAAHQIEQKEQTIAHLDELNKNISEKNELKATMLWGAIALLVVILVLLFITFQ